MKAKIRGIFLSILNMSGEPKDIALAVAIGVFIAFFPILGTHTVLAFALAWLFRVSPAVTLGATFVNNPWTIVPLYLGSLYCGAFITNANISGVSDELGAYMHNPRWDIFVKLAKSIGVPFVVGCLVLGVVAATIAYFATKKSVIAYRGRKEKVAPGA